MILFLQFTLTDTRKFSSFRTELPSKPHWPSPRPFNEFVRGTGGIIERNKGGIPGWVGENFICKIGKAIRFKDKFYFSNGIRATNISKHMYANSSYVLTKYEFVFNVKTNDLTSFITFDIIKNILNELLLSPVSVRVNGKTVVIPVNQLTNILKIYHYQNSTLRKQNPNDCSLDHIMTCTPQCYFYLENNERSHSLKNNFKHISNISNIAELFGGWYDHRNNPLRVWIHQRRTRSPKITENRELRMTIMRLHSEYECLRNLFWAISQDIIKVDQRSQVSDDLQSYFNIAIKAFLTDEQNLEYQSRTKGFFNYFSKVYALASPGDLDHIRSQIEEFNFRANIKNKAIDFFQQNIFMTNKFTNINSTILGQGSDITVRDNYVSNNNQQPDTIIDYPSLIEELKTLIENAPKEAKTTEDFQAVVALSKANDAAKQKDAGGVISALKSGGKFIADIATKFTASVMVELLKAHTTWLK